MADSPPMRWSGIILLFLSFASWAGLEADSAFPVEHIEYIESQAFTEKVEFSKGKTIVVFSDGSCLWTSFPARSCFLFERKLDTFGAALKARKIALYGVDIGFRNLDILERYPILVRPTVIFFFDGREVETFEPKFREEDQVPFRLSWQDDLAKRVTEFLLAH